jgi:hypothetical protein
MAITLLHGDKSDIRVAVEKIVPSIASALSETITYCAADTKGSHRWISIYLLTLLDTLASTGIYASLLSAVHCPGCLWGHESELAAIENNVDSSGQILRYARLKNIPRRTNIKGSTHEFNVLMDC